MGGERRGFPLFAPRGLALRPTSGRVRKALFDILGESIVGARFLDLFAGTGALGIEALSRGGAFSEFLEEATVALAAIRRNLKECGFTDRARVIGGRLPGALSRISPGEEFQFVFADPPYDDRSLESTLRVLGGMRSLSQNAQVVLEHRKLWKPPDALGPLALGRSVRYGDTVLSFFHLSSQAARARETTIDRSPTGPI